MLNDLYQEPLKLDELFDLQYYNEQIDDEPLLSVEDAYLHYEGISKTRMLNPSRFFDTRFYLESNLDVQLASINPLDHYIQYGQYEGRRANKTGDRTFILSERGLAIWNSASRFSNIQYYKKQTNHPNISDIDPVMHYFSFGHINKYSISIFFDVNFYLINNDDIASNDIDPLIHYIEIGYLQGRRSFADGTIVSLPPNILARANLILNFLDVDYYLHQNQELKSTDVDLHCHYLLFGEAQKKEPYKGFYENLKPTDLSQYKSIHITWFEAELLSKGLIHFHEFYKTDTPDPHSLGGIKLIDVLSKKDWESLKSNKHFEANVINTYHKQLPLNINNDSFIENHYDSLEIYTDEKFIQHILTISDKKILSCDIWDTILHRRCFPDEVKLRSARALWLKVGIMSPWLAAMHPIDLFQARRIAESIASVEDFEFRFEEMISKWLELLGILNSNFSKYVVRTEIAIEKDVTYTDPTILSLLQKKIGRKIAISDFYLDKHLLQLIIEENRASYFDDYYISCDYLKTKRKGELFKVVMDEEGINNSEIVHIGDHPLADVEKPRQLHGIDAELFYDSESVRYNATLKTTFWKHINFDFTRHASNILGIAKISSDKKTIAASSLGIAFSGFILSIIEQAIHKDVSKIFFFSREGVFFKEIFDIAVSLDVFDIGDYPNSHILYVSRRSTFAASLDDFNSSGLMRLWSQYSKQSIAALARSLNIFPESWRDAVKHYGLEFDEEVQYPWKDERVASFLKDRSVLNVAREAIWDQRASLIHYLETSGFEPKSSIDKFIVDIGWRGTIQDNIARLVMGKVHGCYLGLDGYLNTQTENATKTGYLMDIPKKKFFGIPEYAALEFLSNCTGGSVIGYENGVPIREIFESEEKSIEQHVTLFQKDILTCCRDIINYVKTHGLVAEDLLPLAQLVVANFMAFPEPRVADAFYQYEHNETFGTGKAQTIKEVKQIDISNRYRSFELYYSESIKLSQLRWPSAYVNSSDYRELRDKIGSVNSIYLPRTDSTLSFPSLIKRRGYKIAIYAPSPILGSGGHRTIYNFSKALDRAGHKVSLFSDGRGTDYGYKENELMGSGVKLYDKWYAHEIPDAAIATVAYSATYISSFFTDSVNKFYLVQDNEAEFNPMSSAYIRAENSYAEGHFHLCIGNWLPHMLYTRFGAQAIGSGLGIDTNIYYPLPKNEHRERLAILYQPEKPRRMDEHCLEAVKYVKEKRPDLEIVFFGSEGRPDLNCNYTHLGLVCDMKDLNKLYNESKIGLCLSLSNPSRIPYEMMAAGCVPVDIYRYNTLFDYDNNTALLAYQSANSIAAALEYLLDNEQELMIRRENSIKSAKMRSLAWEMDGLVSCFESIMTGKPLPNISPPQASYSVLPFLADCDKRSCVRTFLQWQAALAGITLLFDPKSLPR